MLCGYERRHRISLCGLAVTKEVGSKQEFGEIGWRRVQGGSVKQESSA